MRHYRIKETKKNNKKQYIIQIQNRKIAGLYYWTKLNKTIYNKYEDAINGVKEVITREDYDDGKVVYHYIDAYKLLKNKN